MIGILYTAADYLGALQALLPRGRVWPRDSDAVQTQVLSGLTPGFERLNTSAANVLAEIFPPTTYQLLPEWEATLGLPDACAGLAPTTDLQRNQVVARFVGSGGQSAAYMVQYAANLGFDVSVTNYAPFRCGQSHCGSQLGGPEWMYVWSINAPNVNLQSFRCGNSVAGDPLEVWGNTVLECELTEISPAHTLLLFDYT